MEYLTLKAWEVLSEGLSFIESNTFCYIIAKQPVSTHCYVTDLSSINILI